MKALSTFSDYRRAVRIAAGGKTLRTPIGAASVLLARARFDIGPRFHSLYDLSRISKREWHEFVIDIGLKKILRRLNPPEARETVNDKLLFFRHCQLHRLPTIPILASIDRTQNDPKHNGEDAAIWVEHLAAGPDEIFVKLIDGTWGIDAFNAEKTGEHAWRFCGREGSTRDLHAFCLARLRNRRGWIVQPFLRPHPHLNRIMSPYALGTIRAVSFLDRGNASVPYAVLRIPVGTNRADNFAHGSSGNLTAPVDVATGIVGVARGSRSRDWPDMIDVDVHPDTQNRISGFHLPYWRETVELILAGQTSLPALATLGWDIAITEDGPVIVEANATYDVDLLQVAFKRGLKSELLGRPLISSAARA